MMMTMPRVFNRNLFDDFFEDFASPVLRPEVRQNSLMKTDVKENDNSYELSIDLPGYDKENIKAELKDGYMTIKAEQNSEKEEKDTDGRVVRQERYSGSCSRTYFVGEDVTKEDIKARYANGVLQVIVPKKEAKPEINETSYIAIEG